MQPKEMYRKGERTSESAMSWEGWLKKRGIPPNILNMSDVIIAGGAGRDWSFDLLRDNYGDIDIWCRERETRTSVMQELIRTHREQRISPHGIMFIPKYRTPFYSHSERLLLYRNIHLIRKDVETIPDLLNTFDLDVCMFAMSKTEFYLPKRQGYILGVNDTLPVATRILYRIYKHFQMGFTIPNELLIPLIKRSALELSMPNKPAEEVLKCLGVPSLYAP